MSLGVNWHDGAVTTQPPDEVRRLESFAELMAWAMQVWGDSDGGDLPTVRRKASATVKSVLHVDERTVTLDFSDKPNNEVLPTNVHAQWFLRFGLAFHKAGVDKIDDVTGASPGFKNAATTTSRWYRGEGGVETASFRTFCEAVGIPQEVQTYLAERYAAFPKTPTSKRFTKVSFNAQNVRAAIEASADYLAAHPRVNRLAAGRDTASGGASPLPNIGEGPGPSRNLSTPTLYEYDPQTFVPRNEVAASWKEFLRGPHLAFALVGKSGYGKSSIIGSLAAELSDLDRPHLLFRASSLQTPLLERVLDDLHSEDGSPPTSSPGEAGRHRWNRLTHVLSGRQSPLVVFIDALDGVPRHAVSTLAAELDQLAQVDPAGGLLRIVVSCTPDAWRLWSRPMDKPSAFGSAVFGVSEDPIERSAGIPVGEFSEEELNLALQKNGVSDLPRHWKDLCRHPQILRMVARRWRGVEGPLPSQANLTRLVDDLLSAYFAHPDERADALDYLQSVGRAMLKRHVRAIDTPTLRKKPWSKRRLIAARLEQLDLLHNDGHALRFQHPVIGEHFLGRCVHEQIFSASDTRTAREYLEALRADPWTDMPGIVAAAFRYRSEASNLRLTGGLDTTLACLQAMAEFDDPWRVAALMIIEHWSDPEPAYAPVLARLCSIPSYSVREHAARVLGSRRGWEGEVDHTDWQYQETIALSYSYGPACTGDHCTRLWQLADHAHWRVRRAAGYSLHKHWDRCRDHTEWLDVLREHDPARDWRRGHALLIALRGGATEGSPVEDSSVDSAYILKCARSSSSQLRWLTAYYMAQYPTTTFQQLIKIFMKEESHPWVLVTFGQSLVKALSLADDNEAAGLENALGELLSRHAAMVGARVARATQRVRSPRLDGVRELLESNQHPAIRRAMTYSEGTPLSSMNPGLWVEKVALQDFSALGASANSVLDFVAARHPTTFLDDPYVRSFELMRLLLVEAINSLGSHSTAASDFIGHICDDDDEGLRWALVLCLADNPPLPGQTVVDAIRRLSSDGHMWVRRELASHLVRWVEQGVITPVEARRLLAVTGVTADQDGLDAREEVGHFVAASRESLASWEVERSVTSSVDPGTHEPANPARPRIDLIWSLTLICPWDCGMCCVDAVHVTRSGDDVVIRSEGLTRTERIRADRHLDPNVFEAATRARQQRGLELTLLEKLDVIDNLAGYNARIDISGGDPMVQAENIEVIRAAAAAFGRENVTMTATGSGLSRWDIESLAPVIGELNFTFDSPAGGATGLRPPTYARTNLKRAREFGEAGVVVRAECPLTTENCDAASLEQMYRMLTEARIPQLLLMRLFPSGRGTRFADRTPSPSQYRAAIAHLREFERSINDGPRVRLQCALRHFEPGQSSVDGPAVNPCDMLRESFGLLTDGTLLASPWATNQHGLPMADEWILGNLATTPMSEILKTPRAQAFGSRLDENFGHCKIFSFLNSTKESVEDRIFDLADPLYLG